MPGGKFVLMVVDPSRRVVGSNPSRQNLQKHHRTLLFLKSVD